MGIRSQKEKSQPTKQQIKTNSETKVMVTRRERGKEMGEKGEREY